MARLDLSNADISFIMHRFIARLASLRLTLVILVAFGTAILLSYVGTINATWGLAVPLVLFSVNLMAAVATNPLFRRQTPLLLFHLALIVIILLVAAGRLTSLKGLIELSDGEEFDGQLTVTEAAPWHRSRLDRVHFTNNGFRINYAPGVRRQDTRNAVSYLDEEGNPRQAEIGDQHPLVLHGYRFYTSPNKGFAPTFLWLPANGGQPVLGAVHLPSYPMNEYQQALDWELPGTGIKLWTMLQFDEIILDPEANTEFRLPNKHKVIMRIGELRREMQPGEYIDLPQGRLVYDGLRSWMGYTVFYDWTIHWLLVVCMLAVGALGWHFWRKFAARPWNA